MTSQIFFESDNKNNEICPTGPVLVHNSALRASFDPFGLRLSILAGLGFPAFEHHHPETLLGFLQKGVLDAKS